MMKKTKETIILYIIIGCILGIPSLLGLSTLFPQIWGNKNLGNGIYLTWRGIDNQYIMSYTGSSFGDINVLGKPMIPHDVYHPGVYILETKSNKRWIVAKGVDDSLRMHYYVIDKSFKINYSSWAEENSDSIIQSHIIEYSDSVLFSESIIEKKINLHL